MKEQLNRKEKRFTSLFESMNLYSKYRNSHESHQKIVEEIVQVDIKNNPEWYRRQLEAIENE